MTAENSEKSCWWNGGNCFASGIEPKAYREMPKTGSWEEMLKGSGYELHAFFGSEYDSLQIQIHHHQTEAHFLVSVTSADNNLSVFFVADRDQDAFFATWYVKFLRDAALVKQAEALSRIACSLTAFVRHGHGTETVDEYGESSLDNQIRWRRKRREELAAKAKH